MKDGGPAFPVFATTPDGKFTICGGGMTLRQWYAGIAMQAIISAGGPAGIGIGSDKEEYEEDAVSENAFKMADAMITAGEKK